MCEGVNPAIPAYIKLLPLVLLSFAFVYSLFCVPKQSCKIVITGESTTITGCSIDKDLSELIGNIRLASNCL